MSAKCQKTITGHSQNSLQSPSLVRRLLDKSSVAAGDLVYDIGAGRGIISRELVRRHAKVVAVENDSRLFEALKGDFGQDPEISLRREDFLRHALPNRGDYKVFSNIPFNATSDIVRKLFFGHNPPRDCYLVMQKEAAWRFCGVPRETLPSLFLKPWFEVSVLHRFDRTDFEPVPEVEVVLLRIQRRIRPAVSSQLLACYQDFIAYGLTQGGASLRKSLRPVLTHEQIKRLSREFGFGLSAKPTELRYEHWLGIFRYYVANASPERKGLTRGAYVRLVDQQSRLSKRHRTTTHSLIDTEDPIPRKHLRHFDWLNTGSTQFPLSKAGK